MRKSNYDKYPCTHVSGYNDAVFQDYSAIMAELIKKINDSSLPKHIIVIDCYPGVNDDELLNAFVEGLEPVLTINTLDVKYPEAIIADMIEGNMTADRIFGILSCHTIHDFLDPENIATAREQIEGIKEGIVLIYGMGASLIYDANTLIYADMPRWEIQMRYRRQEIGNWGCDNYEEDFFRKYKRGYFIEWRVADRHKVSLFDAIDYFLDTTEANTPKMVCSDAYWQGMMMTANKPFRVVPFFDPAPWGGQWMKDVCDLDRSAANYGWCFDCVPEENSLFMKFGDVRIECPSINLVFKHPKELLGNRVHARFGAEFPIRFDLLDTIGGGNLSFQVHPLTEYIQQTFGMHYTQDESYYMLDAGENASVFLGLKTGIDPTEMIEKLEQAQQDANCPFEAERFTNRIPAKKHDHFLIPAGTCHCSGADAMVLEISATPYIFTFKLWDWGRLGLDGRPRPVHINHGKHVIQWDRTTEWVKTNLVNHIEAIESGDGWSEEKTGLHEREFIETRRHWFTKKTHHHTNGSVNVLNLIEGKQAIIESPDNAFEPFVVHYAETFIIPASVGAYTIRPYGMDEGQQCGTIKAFVRG